MPDPSLREPAANRQVSVSKLRWVESSVTFVAVLACLLTVVGLVLIRFAPAGFGWFPLAAVLCGVFYPFCILPHELGHALAAVALGMRVSRISIGRFGRRLFGVRLFGCTFELRSIPFGGFAYLWPKSARFARMKFFIAILCGPLATCLVLVVSLVVVVHLQMQGTLALLALSCACANVIVLGLTLFPFTVTVDSRQCANDGLLMLQLPFMSNEEIEEWLFWRYYFEGTECQERGDYAGAQKWLTKGLQERPGDVTLLCEMAMVQYATGNFAKAREFFTQCLEQTPQNSDERPYFLNGIACCHLATGGHNELVEADRLSSEAVEAMPRVPEFKDTRGRVLVALGER